MGKVRVIEVHENVFSSNNRAADNLRKRLSDKNVKLFNIMSSPGSGKTTLLSKAINMMKERYKIGVMDVDIKTSLDAQRVADITGVPSLQIHNGGLCHIDAEMTTKAIDEFGGDNYDILFLENIGNLVCPAEFDTGAHKNVMILSVPEGDDKPLKYPLMFSVCDLILISKIDTLDYFDFDMERAKDNIKRLNNDARVICLSAKTGEGVEEFIDWIQDVVSHKSC